MKEPLGLLMAVLLSAAAGHAVSQDRVSVSRERVVEAAAHVEILPSDTERVEVIVDAPTAARAHWRFFVRAPNAGGALELRDTNSAQGTLLGRIPLDALRRGTWSPSLRARSVFFETDATAETEVQIIGFPETTIGTQTPVGTLNLRPVASLTLPRHLRQLIGAVGQLAVVEGQLGSHGEAFFTYCTAFLIAPDRALTAEHCVARGLDGRFAQITFGYTEEAVPLGIGRHDVSVLMKSRAHDIAMLAISPPSETESVFKLAAVEPANDTELLLLQHFGGDPLSVSDDSDCLTTGTLFSGPTFIKDNAAVRLPEIAFGHGCDTTKSSSGAPVLDRRTLSVVGVHQRGYSSGDAQENRALRLSVVQTFVETALASAFNP